MISTRLAAVAAAVLAPGAAAAQSTPGTAPPATPAPAAGLLDQEWVGAIATNAMDIGWNLGMFLAVLLGGWIAAAIARSVVFRLLKRTTLDEKLAEMLGLHLIMDLKQGEDRIEKLAAASVYYALMVLVILAALEVVGLTHAVQPVNDLLSVVTQALPRAAWAAALLGIAWAAGTILRIVVTNALTGAGVDSRLQQLAGDGAESSEQPLAKSTGQVVFWLVMAVGLAGAFDALEITPIAQPLANAMNTVIGALPSVGLAAVIVGGAWIFGRIARTVVTNLTASAGLDRWTERLQLGTLFEQRAASDLLGLLVHAFIQLQALIAALHELGLDTLANPLTDAMGQFWLLVPKVAISALFVVVGVYGGRVVRGVVTRMLKGIGFDRIFDLIGFGRFAEEHHELDEPSELVGYAANVAVVLVTVEQALANLELHTWARYVAAFLEYAVTNVVVALLIVGIGLFASNKVRDLIAASADEGDTSRRYIGEIARYATLVFAVTAAVRHLDVAEDFVLLTFALLFGALCLAVALAFGLGGREVAGKILAEQYEKIDRSRDTPK